jgi:hypothetical protein
MDEDKDRTLADRLALVVQFYLAAARGQLLKDDIEGGLETLRYGASRWLAALAGELEHDAVCAMLPDLDFKWACEAAFTEKTVKTPMPREWQHALKGAPPAGADLIATGHRIVTLADRRVRVDVRPLTRALAALKAEGALADRLTRAVAALWDCEAMVVIERFETVATGGGNGHR